MKKPLMNSITTTLSRAVLLAALAAFALVVTPGTAQAQFIDFTVDEGAIDDDTPDNTFEADLLNGGYVADLVLNPDGTWTETATATFSQYFLDGNALSSPFIGDVEDEGYVILGSLTSSGTYVQDDCGGFDCIIFTFTSQTGLLGIDTDQDGDIDIDLLTASGVGAGTGGSIIFTGGVTGGTGSFVSNFSNNTLAAGIAQDYWPTLASISFTTTISGDINQLELPNVEGDVSVQFSEVQVPEPATLTLLGLGLFGVAGAARRRRSPKA